MACCQGQIQHDARSREIDQMIKSERRNEEKRIKLLLLGTGDSGKSTFLKQLKIIHEQKFTENEILRFKRTLQDNCLSTMKSILKIASEQKDRYPIPKKLKNTATKILETITFDSEIASCIKKLWQNSVIKNVWEDRSEYQLHSSGDYFLNNCEKFADKDYMPTNEDILRTRVMTSGIIETKIEIDGLEFIIIDVGGQRSERRKWIHCFENVNAVIYIAALDEYDMVLREDLNTNRMIESIKLFGEVTSSTWFQNTNFILFLNKKDLFEEKIKKKPLSVLFPEYKGGNNYEEAIKFIEQKFQDSFGSKEDLYIKSTCALDTENIKHIFDSVKDSLLRSSFRAFEV